MDELWQKALTIVFSQGFPGVVILVLAGTCYYLVIWVRRVTKEKDEIQERRLGERETLVSALVRNTDAVEEVTKATEANNRVVERLLDSLQFQQRRGT